jgi:anti-sigma factor RsiW
MDDETLILLGAYHDGELSPREALDMERRLTAEPELRAMLERLGGLSDRLRVSLATSPRMGLEERVAAQLGPRRTAKLTAGMWRTAWPALAASLAIGVALGAAATGGLVSALGPKADRATDDAVLSGHLRALAAPQPFDIASSDRHVVKPWFNGRTTLAPSAPDLADKGFPLVGGRVDVVAGASVPTLVYRHDRHVISVTIVPGGTETPSAELHRDGSTILAWKAGDLAYYAVSDLNTRDLRAFVDLFRQRM